MTGSGVLIGQKDALIKCRKPLEGGGTIWYVDLEKKLFLGEENKVKSYFVGFLQNNYMIVDFAQLDFDDRFNK